MWRQPSKHDKGVCRVRPHNGKLWESGWSIFGWRDDGTLIDCRQNTRPSCPIFFKPTDVQVPI